jgi:hypothetical protein
MSRIRTLSDASVLDAPQAKPKVPSAAAIAREAENKKIRAMIEKLTETSHVYEIILEPGEKALTVRQRLLRVAAESGKDIVVRTHGGGFAVGLATDSRRSRRGRRPRATA